MESGTPLWLVVIVAIASGLISLLLLMLTDEKVATISLAVGIAILLGLALYNVRFDAAKKTAGVSAVLAIVLGAIIVLGHVQVLQQVVPVCGDGVCTPDECSLACADCTPSDCQDGVCTPGFETCSNSQDCPCPQGTICSPRAGSDAYGCSSVTCGDHFCDEGEKEDCCRDCGCPAGYACQENQCIFSSPQVGFTALSPPLRLSATTLAANPRLTNETGIPRPLMAIVVRVQQAAAKDVHVSFDIPGLAHTTQTLGTISPGQERAVQWYLDPSDRFLGITQERETSIDLVISYMDDAKILHQVRRTYPLRILGRSQMGDLTLLTYYVTPDDVPIDKGTPKDIWEKYQGTIQLMPDREAIQFPLETITYHQGTAQDIALVLISAYQKAGLDPGFLETDKGLFIWVHSGNDFAVLDPRMIDKSYTHALVTRPGSLRELSPVHDVWDERHLIPLSLSGEYLPGSSIAVKDDVLQNCSGTAITYRVHNEGVVESPICASSMLALGLETQTKEWCFVLEPYGQENLTQGWNNTHEDCIKPNWRLTLWNQTREWNST